MEYFSLANRNRELYNTSAGDFMNAQELHQYLPGIIDIINKTNGPGMNPLPMERPSLPGSSLPSVPPTTNMQNKIPEAVAQGNTIAVSLPGKEVLMELCSVGTPLNTYLRKAYSKGSLYFLNNKNRDIGQ